MPGPAVLHVNAFTVEIAGHMYKFGPIHEHFDSFMLALIALFIFQAASQEYALVRAEEYYRQSGQRPPWEPPPPPRDDVYVSPPPYDRDR